MAEAQSIPATPEAARAEIDAKEADPEFRKALHTGDHPGHRAAQETMTTLFKIGFGVPQPPTRPPGAPPAAALTTEQKAAEQKASAEAMLEYRLGGSGRWERRLESARARMGPALIEPIEDAGLGDDPETIVRLVQLAEADDSHGSLRSAVLGFLDDGIAFDEAKAEIGRREADVAFMKLLSDKGAPGRSVAQAEMTALHLLGEPPGWLLKVLQKASE